MLIWNLPALMHMDKKRRKPKDKQPKELEQLKVFELFSCFCFLSVTIINVIIAAIQAQPLVFKYV